jgi:pimeloyl-ACP methyl ester carboxylesterase
LVASQELAGLVGGFVSIEGNLVGQDCGLVSRGTAELPLAEFVDTSYPAFLTSLAGSPHADHRAWAGWYAQADPVAVHRAAASLVEWSDSGKLLDLFTSQPRPAYVHGGDSDDLGYLLPLLRGVRVYSIPRSRHFPMVDNPPAFWDAVTDAITVAA